MSEFKPTEQSKVRRLAERGRYDHRTVYSILDEGFICHVGFVAADGRPVVIPTAYGRDQDRIYIHGSAGSRMQRMLAAGIDVSVTVTLVDGLVLARSGFNSSINYRSVVVLGKARPVTDPEEKARALYLFSEHLLPGRWDEIRGPSDKELEQTSVLVIELDEVSAKVRGGPPHDDEQDYALPVWAGVLPMEVRFGKPEADAKLAGGVGVPEYVRKASRKGNRDTEMA